MRKRLILVLVLGMAALAALIGNAVIGAQANHVWPSSYAIVVNTGGDGVNVRTGAGTGYKVVTVMPEGARAYVRGSALAASGYWWYPIEYHGAVGYAVSDFLLSSYDTGDLAARTANATITAYTPYDPGVGQITKSGTRVRWGVVAVDPRYIPLGAKLRIEGFDTVFRAEDTGGGIKGWWIDIFTDDLDWALRFGRQTRKITILQE